MLTQQQLAYGQQKNREHIWQQAKAERREFKIKLNELLGHSLEWTEHDKDMTGVRYEMLCRNSNITPW